MSFVSILHIQYYEYRKWKQEQKKVPDIFNGEKIPLKNLKSLLSDKHSDNLQEKKNKPFLLGPIN